MKLIFKGICTHLIDQVAGTVKHNVLLPASKGYRVLRPDGTELAIPDHTPYLAIDPADLIGDPEAFAETGLTTMSGNKPLRWDLGPRVRIGFDGIETPLRYADPAMRQLPHLNEKITTELDPQIRDGKHPSSVTAIVELTAGYVEVGRDQGGARFVQVSSQQESPWRIRIGDRGLFLTVAADATVMIGNHDTDSATPCDVFDYLLHYRLTDRKWVDPADFFVPPADPSLVIILEDSTTLTSCSNSAYP